MHEILRNLRPDAFVLDLGSGSGTFGPECCPGAHIIRLDKGLPDVEHVDGFVQADAARLPFPDAMFDAVVSNHSLEHMDDLENVLKEIGRVVRHPGRLYVAVPDGSTVTDRLYRWVFHGGGHVNLFCSASDATTKIARATALTPVATRVLYASLGVFRRDRVAHPLPRRLWILGNGNPRFIGFVSYALRVLDRVFRTRASIYGWAFYFGDIPEQIETAPWKNVCNSCGSATSTACLLVNNLVRSQFLMVRSYRCPACGASNLFMNDDPGEISE